MRQPTTTELHEAFEIFSRNLLGCFALYAWKTSVYPFLIAHRELHDGPISICQNAAAHSSFVCMRSIDDFFRLSANAPFDDDIIAHDFGYKGYSRPLQQNVRVRINKSIVHPSYEPIWSPEIHRGESGNGSFDIPAIVRPLVDRATHFLEFCKEAPVFSSQHHQVYIEELLNVIKIQMKNLEGIADIERASKQT